MNKYEIIELDHVEVTVDVSLLSKEDTMYFNATKMAKQFSRKSSHWLQLEATKDYVKALLKSKGRESRRLESELIQTVSGKYGGTYLHKDLALEFARWLSADFRVSLDGWVMDRLSQEAGWKERRLASKTGYLPLTIAVEAAHDDPKFYHYSNEANLINRIMLGMTAKQYKEEHGTDNVRDNLSVGELKTLEKLQRANTTMIELEMEFEPRKDKLKFLYNKEMALLN